MPGFPPVFPLFPPRFPFFAGFPYFGCYSFRDFPPPIPPASTGIPDPIPAAFPGSPPRPRPPQGHLRDHEGSPKGFFFPRNSGFFPFWRMVWPGISRNSRIPSLPVPSVPGHCAGISRCLQEQSPALPRAITAPFGPFLGILLDFSMDFCSFPSPPGRRSGSLQ